MSYICNLMCDRIGDAGQTDTSFAMDPAMSINVASGAKLELDYVGTNEVANLRLSGRRVIGVVDATTHPLHITGTGALYAKPRGGVVIEFQ